MDLNNSHEMQARWTRFSMILASCIPLICFLIPLNAQSSSGEPFTNRRDTIYIAAEPDYPPWSMVDENGNPDGLSVELFLAAAEAAGLTVDAKTGIWNIIMQDLAEGRIDALPLVGRTPDREAIFDFSMPYSSLHGAIFVNKKSHGIQTLEDLHDKQVLVMRGDNAEEFVRRADISEKIITTNTYEEAFNMLSRGEGDAVISQRITGILLLRQLNIRNVKPLDMHLPEFKQDFCFAVKKGDEELLKRLNEGLSIIIANNSFGEIRKRWLGNISDREITPAELLRWSLYIFIPLIILTSLLWIIILRRHVRKRTARLKEEISQHEKTVSELHHKQGLLSESEEQIRLLLNSTAEGIYGIDTDGNCTFINKSAMDALLITGQEQAIGKNMHGLIHHSKSDGSHYDIEECNILNAFKLGKGVHSNNEKLWRMDGTGFDAEYFSHPIRIDNEVKGAVVTFWDITVSKREREELKKIRNKLEEEVEERTSELKEKVNILNNNQKAMLYMVEDLNRITAELKTERKKLQESNRELEAFTYSVSHDLRAPLRAINGFSKFLLEDYSELLDEEGKRYINTIRDNATKMDQLITDMLNLSRVSKSELKPIKTDIYSLANEVYDEVASGDQKDEFEFIIEKIPPVNCDHGLMKQVWQNLIENALKYSAKSETHRIEISAKEGKSDVTYFIRDYGAGFNPRYKHKLFGLFQRLHSGDDFEGNGVGLAIIQRIIQRHEGEVGADGNPEKGAIFWFRLPKE
ncbi:MAG: transporter substrate-binding domain-containing protein [Bacteroidales bacterium]|nr:transporter substrate-binding domain-containing protein [Bacteroidales bacterium]